MASMIAVRWPGRCEHPAELSLALYLALTGVGLMASGDLRGAMLHGLGVLGVVAVRALSPPPERSLLRCAWPLLAILPLYRETGALGAALWGRTFDGPVLAWEEALFGTSPALWLCERFPWLWLSEVLHLGYMAFWALLPALGAPLLAAGRRRDFQAFAWTTLNCYLLCFAAFVLFPVEGPRLLFPPLPEAVQGPITRLCHAITSAGAAPAAAFPSAHVAVSLAVAAGAARWCRPLLAPLAVVALAIAGATVYGRFHYAVDVLAGVAWAGAAWRLAGPRAFEALCPGEVPTPRGGPPG